MAKHGDVWRSKCGMMELRCGDYREVLADVECDAVITDPPYSKRTEIGQRSGNANGGGGILYGHVTPEWWCSFFVFWARRVGRWFVGFGDHKSVDWALDVVGGIDGWYGFPPVIWAKTDAAPRMLADGPSPQHETIAVARPRRTLDPSEKIYRRGWYMGESRSGRTGLIGGKPPWLMSALVRDYSRKGDLVCDPCAGGGTTLLAAAMEGRRAIGAEIDPETFELAVKRLSAGYTPDLFAGVQP